MSPGLLPVSAHRVERSERFRKGLAAIDNN
ncbi:hypothetical protein AGR2A_Lc90089 [Agrobacterium genomosp. 2 str. CFBP 5494]|uniref:Uncharacterized protein n=1 Tax=Agrobacterium genomosp. 2 str. CFBP 5494 TaxID=1183436 RepID=A0A9W5F524_9HYPH|nr:hypothetical protein AGR2A_Lc90089 [Agrobacterium genomosp. 2 str. CFBP 5494]